MSLNSGSCWDILELESTEDKKLIKRAYHKLLRQYKPDESPKEFKILYQAYQDALEWEEPYVWDEEEWENEDDNWDDEDFPEKNVEFEDTYEQTDEEIEVDSIHDEYYIKWNSFQEKIDALTVENNYPELFNKLENWKFIEELELESDIELHQEAARYLFNAIDEFDEEHESFILSAEVIRYLNRIFLWDKYWQEYDVNSTIFEYFSVAKVRPNVSKVTPKLYPIASHQKRAAAFLIDMSIAAFIIVMFQGDLRGIPILYMVIYTIPYWSLSIRTFGQHLMNLRALEGDECEKTTQTARSIRLIFTGLTLFTIYIIIDDPSTVHPIPYLILGFSTGLFNRDGRLLQDWSGTRIYDVSKD